MHNKNFLIGLVCLASFACGGIAVMAFHYFTSTADAALISNALAQKVNQLQSQVENLQQAELPRNDESLLARLNGENDEEKNTSLSALIEQQLTGLTQRVEQLGKDVRLIRDAQDRMPVPTTDTNRTPSTDSQTPQSLAKPQETIVKTRAEVISGLYETVGQQTPDVDQAQALKSNFEQRLSGNEFAGNLYVSTTQCGERSCIVEILAPAEEDVELAGETAGDEIPDEYTGYSVFTNTNVDGTHKITLYMQKP